MDWLGAIPPRPKRADTVVFAIEVTNIAPAEFLHRPRRSILGRRRDLQVGVCRHQAETMDGDTVSAHRALQHQQVRFAVLIVAEHSATIVTAVADVETDARG